MIIWHTEDTYKDKFHKRAEVIYVAKDLAARGVIKCVLCGGYLTIHGCYSRHYRDDEDIAHRGWVAQGRCAECNVFPALIPNFLMPHKHFSAQVIESALSQYEMGNGSTSSTECPASNSTIFRWVKQFAERGEQAMGWLLSALLISALYIRGIRYPGLALITGRANLVIISNSSQ
jgi:hypothetical protein